MKPLILINFKNYKESVGFAGIKLAKNIFSVKSKKYAVTIAPSIVLLKELAGLKQGKVFAQYVDYHMHGAYTGSILPAEVVEVGGYGTILNHSEKKIPFGILQNIVLECKRVHLQTVICASSLAEVSLIAHLKPDYIAYEPAELIGGDVSVTSAKKNVIADAVKSVKKKSPLTKILCGAGIHSHEDLVKALKLGASGVLLSHALVCAKKPKKKLKELLK